MNIESLTPIQLKQYLRQHIEVLDVSRRDFATNLVEFLDRKQYWSEKQLTWARRLAQSIHDELRSREPAQPVVDVAIQGLDLGDVKPLVAMLTRARSLGVVYPAIRMEEFIIRLPKTADLDLVVRVASDKSFLGKFQDSRWFVHPRYRNLRIEEDFLALMREYLEQPIEKSSLMGRRFGRCMFCWRTLERDASINVGYGPICAERYGLPWGDNTTSWRDQVKETSSDTIYTPV